MSTLPAGFELEENPQGQSSLPEGFELESGQPSEGSSLPPGFEMEEDVNSTPLEQAAASAEGAAQGFAGPVVPFLENTLSKFGVPGVSYEDQLARERANPGLHAASEAAGLGAGLWTGTGEAGLIASAAEHLLPEALPVVGKIGAKAFSALVQNAAIQGGNEVTSAIMDRDPQQSASGALMHMGAAGLFGAGTSVAFSSAPLALKALESQKVGTRMQEFLAGIADFTNPGKYFPEGSSVSKYYDMGKEFIPGLAEKVSTGAGNIASGSAAAIVPGAQISPSVFLASYETTKKVIDPFINKIIGKPLTEAAKKIAYPLAVKMLSSGETGGFYEALDHAADVNKGISKATKVVENVFRLGSQQAIENIVSDKDRQKVKDYIDEGGTTPEIQEQMQQNGQPQTPAFAKGGEVRAPNQPSALATHYPDQAAMLMSAKQRISGYLKTLKPQDNPMKKPFDKGMDQKQQEKKYNKAIDLAINPLSILNKVKDGSLTSEEIGHFSQMFPDVRDHLSKTLTKKIIDQQIKKESPNYKTRQGLSLFLGAPMDSSFDPVNIQAAQAVFINKPAATPAGASGPKPKKDTAKLGEAARQSLTADQAAQTRQTSER